MHIRNFESLTKEKNKFYEIIKLNLLKFKGSASKN